MAHLNFQPFLNCAGTSRNIFHHKCNGCPDNFCYVCSEYVGQRNKRNITANIKFLYEKCFNIEISQQDKSWVPHCICGSCYTMMNRYNLSEGKAKLKFTTPAKWKEPKDKTDCYFCLTKIEGAKKINKKEIVYPANASVEFPNKEFIQSLENEESRDSFTVGFDALNVDDDSTNQINENHIDSNKHTSNEKHSSTSEEEFSSDSDEEYVPIGKDRTVEKFDQKSLNDLFRKSGLSKEQSEFMASEFKRRNMLTKGTKVSVYRNREERFRKYFKEDSNMVYCTDVKGLIDEFKPNMYNPENWRLFIDSSMRSLKAVLLHITNKYAPIPLAHSTVLKEEYSNLELLSTKIKYEEHNWQICGDLKILSMILGQQSGFTNYPCYLCMFDSRDRENHYKKKIWTSRESFEPEKQNIIKKPLVDPSKILIPPLHIKLGLIKQLVKALDKEGECFKYLSKVFPKKSDGKLSGGIFDGPEIRTLFRDENFDKTMNDVEKAAWSSFKEVSTKFLGNTKDAKYKDIVKRMVRSFEKLGCLMNLKLHFLHSHVDQFPENNGDFNEEHGERFHQDLKDFERRFQGNWGINMLADYCWMMKRETSSKKGQKRVRNPLHRSFEEKRVRKRKAI